MSKYYIECDGCGKDVMFRKAKRIKNSYYCYFCWKDLVHIISMSYLDYSEIGLIAPVPKLVVKNRMFKNGNKI